MLYKCGEKREQKWYNRDIFPLIPVITIRNANEYNTLGITIQWLFLTMWLLDSVQFEFAFIADTHFGIGIKGLLPYLRWVITIPCPEVVGMWIHKHLDREPKSTTCQRY